MGLDYHYDFAPRDVQQAVFTAQVALAVELDLPVAIHTREAFDDTIAILKDAGRGRVRGVMHCFTGTAAEAEAALNLGFYLSIPGIVTFPKAGALRDVVRGVPLDRVLVETDAPYLAPVPHRGKRNEPSFLGETVKQLAAIHGHPVDAVAEQIRMNFTALVLHGLSAISVFTDLAGVRLLLFSFFLSVLLIAFLWFAPRHSESRSSSHTPR
jgi:TatD DNase family protein